MDLWKKVKQSIKRKPDATHTPIYGVKPGLKKDSASDNSSSNNANSDSVPSATKSDAEPVKQSEDSVNYNGNDNDGAGPVSDQAIICLGPPPEPISTPNKVNTEGVSAAILLNGPAYTSSSQPSNPGASGASGAAGWESLIETDKEEFIKRVGGSDVTHLRHLVISAYDKLKSPPPAGSTASPAGTGTEDVHVEPADLEQKSPGGFILLPPPVPEAAAPHELIEEGDEKEGELDSDTAKAMISELSNELELRYQEHLGGQESAGHRSAPSSLRKRDGGRSPNRVRFDSNPVMLSSRPQSAPSTTNNSPNGKQGKSVPNTDPSQGSSAPPAGGGKKYRTRSSEYKRLMNLAESTLLNELDACDNSGANANVSASNRVFKDKHEMCMCIISSYFPARERESAAQEKVLMYSPMRAQSAALLREIADDPGAGAGAGAGAANGHVPAGGPGSALTTLAPQSSLRRNQPSSDSGKGSALSRLATPKTIKAKTPITSGAHTHPEAHAFSGRPIPQIPAQSNRVLHSDSSASLLQPNIWRRNTESTGKNSSGGAGASQTDQGFTSSGGSHNVGMNSSGGKSPAGGGRLRGPTVRTVSPTHGHSHGHGHFSAAASQEKQQQLISLMDKVHLSPATVAYNTSAMAHTLAQSPVHQIANLIHKRKQNASEQARSQSPAARSSGGDSAAGGIAATEAAPIKSPGVTFADPPPARPAGGTHAQRMMAQHTAKPTRRDSNSAGGLLSPNGHGGHGFARSVSPARKPIFAKSPSSASKPSASPGNLKYDTARKLGSPSFMKFQAASVLSPRGASTSRTYSSTSSGGVSSAPITPIRHPGTAAGGTPSSAGRPGLVLSPSTSARASRQEVVAVEDAWQRVHKPLLLAGASFLNPNAGTGTQFRLQRDLQSFTFTDEASSSVSNASGAISVPLAEVKLLVLPKKHGPQSFGVVTEGAQYEFVANSSEEQKKWLQALKIAMRRTRDPAFSSYVQDEQM